MKEKIKYSILNPEDLPDLPDKEIVTIENLGDFEVSRGVIDIFTDKELKKELYSEAIELVKESFMEIRNDISMKLYGKDFKKLNQKQKENIETIMPIKIRFERYIAGPPEVPPPPPDSLLIDDIEMESDI